MSFLQKIDELFEASCLQFSVPLKSDNFHTYIPIEIYNDTHRFQFLIRKGKKSKILILAGQQRVYLTELESFLISGTSKRTIHFQKNRFYKSNNAPSVVDYTLSSTNQSIAISTHIETLKVHIVAHRPRPNPSASSLPQSHPSSP